MKTEKKKMRKNEKTFTERRSGSEVSFHRCLGGSDSGSFGFGRTHFLRSGEMEKAEMSKREREDRRKIAVKAVVERMVQRQILTCNFEVRVLQAIKAERFEGEDIKKELDRVIAKMYQSTRS